MTEETITILDEETNADVAEAAEPEETLATEEASEQEEPVELTAEQFIAELQVQNQELAEQVKRTAAEFQNFRRRQVEEKKRDKVFAREDIIKTMLPILDHLERTLNAANQGGEGAFDSLLEGVKLIDKDVKKIFSEHGLEAIAAKGETFDAALHQAVMMEETNEVPDQTILQELQTGYKLDDRVIRPSMVQVARNIEN